MIQKKCNNNPEVVLNRLGLKLPETLGPIGSYIPYKKNGTQIYMSGLGPMWDKVPQFYGKIGRELSKEDGYKASRLTALNVIAQIKNAVGDLSKVKNFINVIGYVNCTDDFIDQPYVINGFSDLIIEVFGECGKHARCAVPTGTLPMDTPVEIQVIIEVEE
ncbi:RidA family protein [Clostridiaceae bacterium M8S5]|nr:RidA family protein [Clostridiaceae bacterium M8S5]